MWKDLKEFSKLKKELLSKRKQIVDVILFGSLTRGKGKPGDIDLCLVFRDTINWVMVKELQRKLGERYHLSALKVDDFFTKTHSLARTLLLEGVSLISGKRKADTFGLTAKLLYSYDLTKEKASKKVRFVYLLRGRGKEGLVKKWGGEFVSSNTFIIPMDKDSEMQEILTEWKIRYKRKKILFMD